MILDGFEFHRQCNQVDKDRTERHGQYRIQQQPEALPPDAENEERHIQHDDRHADRHRGKKAVERLGKTGKAAHDDVVWNKERVKREGVDKAAQCNEQRVFYNT